MCQWIPLYQSSTRKNCIQLYISICVCVFQGFHINMCYIRYMYAIKYVCILGFFNVHAYLFVMNLRIHTYLYV